MRLPFVFDDGVDQATINSIGEQIKAYKGVTKVEYVSAEEAWDEWSKQYFWGYRTGI